MRSLTPLTRPSSMSSSKNKEATRFLFAASEIECAEWVSLPSTKTAGQSSAEWRDAVAPGHIVPDDGGLCLAKQIVSPISPAVIGCIVVSRGWKTGGESNVWVGEAGAGEPTCVGWK